MHNKFIFFLISFLTYIACLGLQCQLPQAYHLGLGKISCFMLLLWYSQIIVSSIISLNVRNIVEFRQLAQCNHCNLCNHCSDFAPVHSGVPQGSVLGPILFTMYIKPLSAIIDSHSIIHHSFADDLQLQMSAPPDRISELLHSMQSCISDVKAWSTANMLKLNDSKTELMLVTSKRSKHLHNLPTSITIGNVVVFCFAVCIVSV